MTSQNGFTGISFPFRLNNQGGVVTTTTSNINAEHINESVEQILGTEYLERDREVDIYSDVDSLLFEPNDESLQQVLKFKIAKVLNDLEDRISVEEEDITFNVYTEEGVDYLYANIKYLVERYQTYQEVNVRVGEVNE